MYILIYVLSAIILAKQLSLPIWGISLLLVALLLIDLLRWSIKYNAKDKKCSETKYLLETILHEIGGKREKR